MRLPVPGPVLRQPARPAAASSSAVASRVTQPVGQPDTGNQAPAHQALEHVSGKSVSVVHGAPLRQGRSIQQYRTHSLVADRRVGHREVDAEVGQTNVGVDAKATGTQRLGNLFAVAVRSFSSGVLVDSRGGTVLCSSR